MVVENITTEKTGWFRENCYKILFSFLAFFIYSALFFARSYDDNRSTSWQDVFTVANPVNVFYLLSICIPAVWLLSKLSFPERYPSFFLFCSSFTIAAFFWSVPEAVVDTSRYFMQAKHLELYGAGFFLREWGRAITVWTDMPVVPFFYGLIFRFFGESRIYIQIFSTLLFSLSTVLTYGIGKKLWDADTGFYAGLLLLGIPYLFSQIPLMLVDVPVMFFLLLAIFSFIHAIEKGKAIRIFSSSFAITLAFYSKYSMGMMLSVLIVLALTYHTALPKIRTSVYLTRVFGIFLATAFLTGMVFVYKYDCMSEQIRLLVSYQKPGLQKWGESFISTFFFQIHPLLTLFAAFSSYAAWRKKDIRYFAILWLVALVIFLQIRRIRYIIMVFPMLTLMASYGLQRIREKTNIRFISLSVVAFSIAVGVSAYLPFLQGYSASNLQNAGKYLDALKVTGAEVFTVTSKSSVANPAVLVAILDLYTKAQLRYNYDEKTAYPAEKTATSPLRFSWEYKNPQYYRVTEKTAAGGSSAVVIISDGIAEELRGELKQKVSGLGKKVSFDITDNIYEFQPVVAVYY